MILNREPTNKEIAEAMGLSVDRVKELISREGIDCKPYIWLNPEKKNFYDFTIDDIKVAGYPMKEIKEKNPQITAFKDNLGI